MRNLAIYLSAVAVLHGSSALRHGASQIRDLLAFPKYQVQFLNDLPLSTSDADRCVILGVEREDEFQRLHPSLSERKRVGDGSTEPSPARLTLVPMSLTLPGSDDEPSDFLCLLPSGNTTAAQTAHLEQIESHAEEIDPEQSWQALSHLDGKCLFSTHGWFTYSYCHNSHIRQFKAARHPHPHPPGGYIPEEDTQYDAYTLGQAHPQPRKKAALPPGHTSLTRPETGVDRAKSHENSVSLGLGASQRYLVQRWSDGTTCDKTGRPRETEVQIHCSMTTNDIIYIIKELAICQYVLIIHSPHLCSLPGFKAEHADVESAGIRCRQVLSDEAFGKRMAEREGREVLGLPFDSRPAGMEEKAESGMLSGGMKGTPSVAENAGLGAITIDGVNDDVLRSMLTKALEAIQNGQRQDGSESSDAGSDGEGGDHDDVVFFSFEEDGEGGAVLLDADTVADGEGGAANGQKQGMAQEERALILNAVKAYLERKGDREQEVEQGEEERVRDEL